MPLTRVLGKGRSTALEAAEFAQLRARYARTAVDVGTGDGRFAYQLASSAPELLVIGLDALAEHMAERAATAARKPPKGGRPNLLFVRAAIESPPMELAHAADEVHVLLPWGALLEGVVLARDDVLGGIASLCTTGARVSVILNGEIWVDSTPTRYEPLPVPTPEYVADVVAPGFARHGITLGPAQYMTAEAAKALATTWARKLGHGRDHPRFVQFEGVASGTAAS
jgi:16S rRNA (adenine(1408)-N(1))-methyltransferase